jgi:hypothetical protein
MGYCLSSPLHILGKNGKTEPCYGAVTRLQRSHACGVDIRWCDILQEGRPWCPAQSDGGNTEHRLLGCFVVHLIREGASLLLRWAAAALRET